MYHAVWTINYFSAFLYIRYVFAVGWVGEYVGNTLLVLVSLCFGFVEKIHRNVFSNRSCIRKTFWPVTFLSSPCKQAVSLARPLMYGLLLKIFIYPVRISISVDIITGNKHTMCHCLASFSHDTLSLSILSMHETK